MYIYFINRNHVLLYICDSFYISAISLLYFCLSCNISEYFYVISLLSFRAENNPDQHQGRSSRKQDEKVSRYMNGLRYDIQDEMSMVTIRTLEDSYQMALKDEEKVSRKQGQRGRGRSQSRGKLVVQDKSQKPKEDWKKP
jgi:hypothetical protein